MADSVAAYFRSARNRNRGKHKRLGSVILIQRWFRRVRFGPVARGKVKHRIFGLKAKVGQRVTSKVKKIHPLQKLFSSPRRKRMYDSGGRDDGPERNRLLGSPQSVGYDFESAQRLKSAANRVETTNKYLFPFFFY